MNYPKGTRPYTEGMELKKNEVVVECYYKKEVWQSRIEAQEFYLDAALSCEGSESSRYMKIYGDLVEGLQFCDDDY